MISILLPALSSARENGRVGKCLANLRSIAQAGSVYLFEQKDMPWVLPGGYTVSGKTYTFDVISEYIWGGAMPSSTDARFIEIGGPGLPPSRTDVYHVAPRERPLNPYLSSIVSWNASPTDPPASPRDDVIDTPDYFKCPSDANPYVPVVGEFNSPPTDEALQPCWEWWGTSYPINWYWPYYYLAAPPGGEEPYTRFDAVIGGQWNVIGLGRHMLNNRLARFTSEFVMFYENQLNFALEAARPPGYVGGPWASEVKHLRGWHRKQNVHAATFFDGSARYRRFDTRFVFGAGWTIWPDKPWEGKWAAYEDVVPE